MNVSHESLHEPTADLLWRESYYFNLLGSDLVLETTIGLRPSQGVVERMALIFHQDETLVLIEPGRLAALETRAGEEGRGAWSRSNPAVGHRCQRRQRPGRGGRRRDE
jgi:hypothetical protein